MITRKNRLEPTLILQSVNDVTNCKRNKKEKHFFFSSYKVYIVNQTQIESRDQKKFTGSGIKFCNKCGIRDQNLRSKSGISWQKVYLVRTLDFECRNTYFSEKKIASKFRSYSSEVLSDVL